MSGERLDPIIEGSLASICSTGSSQVNNTQPRRGSNAAYSLTSRRGSLSDDQLHRSLSRYHSPLNGSTSASEGSTGTLRKATSVAAPGPAANAAPTAASTLGVPLPLTTSRRKSQDRGSAGNTTAGIREETIEQGVAHNPAHYTTNRNPESANVTHTTQNSTQASVEGSGTLVDLAPSQQLWSSSLTLLKARQARLAADGKARLPPAAGPGEATATPKTPMVGWGMGDDTIDDDPGTDKENNKDGKPNKSRPSSGQSRKSLKARAGPERSRSKHSVPSSPPNPAAPFPTSPSFIMSETSSVTLGRRPPSPVLPRLPREQKKKRKKKLSMVLKGFGKQVRLFFVGTKIGVISATGSATTSNTELSGFW